MSGFGNLGDVNSKRKFSVIANDIKLLQAIYQLRTSTFVYDDSKNDMLQ
jgi:hypothetical protein